jgi:hypothetical protein
LVILQLKNLITIFIKKKKLRRKFFNYRTKTFLILVPETLACISNTANLVANSSNQNDTPSKIQKIIGSNLPRHILQRKQVAKLNKKKLIENNEKENNN